MVKTRVKIFILNKKNRRRTVVCDAIVQLPNRNIMVVKRVNKKIKKHDGCYQTTPKCVRANGKPVYLQRIERVQGHKISKFQKKKIRRNERNHGVDRFIMVIDLRRTGKQHRPNRWPPPHPHTGGGLRTVLILCFSTFFKTTACEFPSADFSSQKRQDTNDSRRLPAHEILLINKITIP